MADAGAGPWPEGRRDDYLASYDGDRFAESIRYVQAYPVDLEILRNLLPRVLTPVQIINGLRDPVVPLVNAKYLDHHLPHSELRVIDAGHFIWEDAAEEYAALVTAWWRDGFAQCMNRSTSNAAGS
jgi:pimeloyl-ACP methyl ester carboxylesterase